MNIEHLGGRTPGQRPIAIAEHIFLASPDILVLEEIYDNDEENDTRTNEDLTTVFELLRQNELHDWDFLLLPNKAINDKSQLCAVAWNRKRVSIVGEPMRLNVSVNDDPHNCWDRHPHAIKFSRGENKTDLVVVPLQNGPFLKSLVSSRSKPNEQKSARYRTWHLLSAVSCQHRRTSQIGGSRVL